MSDTLDSGSPTTASGNQAAVGPRRQADLVDFVLPLSSRWRSLLVVPLVACALAYAGTFLMDTIYAASATFLPPQQQPQSAAVSALSSLGALAGIGGAGLKTSADQYVSLMQSVDVADRLVDRYKLMSVYDVRYRDQARKKLAQRSSFRVGKKDGLITLEVEDTDPRRAAAIANDYVSELRRVTSELAITEAQQRRVFFERQMQEAKERLVNAQVAMQETGFDLGALKSEPKAAADSYANLRAQLTTAQVKLQMMRSSMSDTNLEVVQQKAIVQGLQEKTDALEASVAPDGTKQADYVGKYREFKYQETLFEQMSRQYELARVDEAREGALIQVVDAAKPAERKSLPHRLTIAVAVAVLTELLWALALIGRDRYRAALLDSHTAERMRILRESFRRG